VQQPTQQRILETLAVVEKNIAQTHHHHIMDQLDRLGGMEEAGRDPAQLRALLRDMSGVARRPLTVEVRLTATRHLYRMSGGPAVYYVDGTDIYPAGGGTRAFYIDGTTVYAHGTGEQTFWIDGKCLYEHGAGARARFYFAE